MTVLESLPVSLRLGPVHLTVGDVGRSIAWYQRSLGLRLRAREPGGAQLGDADATVIVLHEDPEARPPGHHAHLFHYCLLYPTREELARAAVRLEATRTEVTNMNDRHTHEAIYLKDADGVTVELAWDRPRDRWPADPYGHAPVPLDLDGLLATVAGEPPGDLVGDGLAIGHVHLVVGDVEEAIEFYCRQLGFDLKYNVGSDDYSIHAAAFFSVGGYHHQVATNLLAGERVGPQPDHTLGLRHWTIELPGASDVAATRTRLETAGHGLESLENGFAVMDPWRIPLQIIS